MCGKIPYPMEGVSYMAEDIKTGDGAPLRPSTAAFADYALLMALYECWEKARGDAMVPSKFDFEGTMLEHPEILPDLTMLEMTPTGELRYLFIGSDRVFRINQDQTRETMEGAFAPKVRKFVADWTRSSLQRPHISMWRARTLLSSGAQASSVNLSVPLSNEKGVPTCCVSMTIFDEVFLREAEKGGYLIGSIGITVTPIDIGCGVPDLPLTAE